jgi:hypothetical protein
MCSLMMICDLLSKHVGAVKIVLKKSFKINEIQLVHLLVVRYLVKVTMKFLNMYEMGQFITDHKTGSEKD